MLRWFERSGRQSPRFRRRKNPDDRNITRMARTTEAAPATSIQTTSITCNLIDNEGNEITSGPGSAIEVFARCSGTTTWDEAEPALSDDEYVFVVWIAGKWWIDQTFQISDIC